MSSVSTKKSILFAAVLSALSILLITFPANAFKPGEFARPIIICKIGGNLLADAVKLRDAGADSEGLEIVNAMLEKGQCVQNIYGIPMKIKGAIFHGKDISVYEIVDPADESVVYYTLGEGPRGQHQI